MSHVQPAQNTTRRAFLRTGTAAVAALPVAAVPAIVAASNAAAFDALWERFKQAKVEEAGAVRAYEEANAKVPWWAKTGPAYVTSRGMMEDGPVVGWPAIQDYEPPTHSIMQTLIRPGLSDLSRRFEAEASMWGRERALPVYRKRLRALAARKRAQRAEEERAGLTAASARLDRVCDELWEIEKAIEALPLSLTTATALSLIWFVLEMSGDQSLADASGGRELLVTLRAMHPYLTGPISKDIGVLLSEPNRPIRETWMRAGFWPKADVGEAA